MKITDIAPYSELGQPLAHRYLEFVGANDKNVSGKSNKFWEVAIFKKGGAWIVVRRWGKYGAKGQIKEEAFYSMWSAEEVMGDVARKKHDKGYTREIDVITRLGTLIEED